MGIADLFKGKYYGKTVFVTGHSGFGGIWLSAWLVLLGAKVVGYSDKLISERARVRLSELIENIKEIKEDVRNKLPLERAIKETQPDIIFHLAAQSLVIHSYICPLETFETNVLGTLNLLEIIRNSHLPIAVVFITSDKVYMNKESKKGYFENDNLGGYDPYSASKVMSEIALSTYMQSSNEPNFSVNPLKISSVRSGNWIGGGDFSEYRLIPDLVKALNEKREAILRNPNSIRPWQFVLDPLKGFLMLGSKLLSDCNNFCGAWNFGPSNLKHYSCEDLFRFFLNEWGSGNYSIMTDRNSYHETKILTLNCQKALEVLHWMPTYNIIDAVKNTVEWYKLYIERYSNLNIMNDMTSVYYEQINSYTIRSRTVCK